MKTLKHALCVEGVFVPVPLYSIGDRVADVVDTSCIGVIIGQRFNIETNVWEYYICWSTTPWHWLSQPFWQYDPALDEDFYPLHQMDRR